MSEGGAAGEGVPDRWLVLGLERPAADEVAGFYIEALLALGSRGVEESAERLTVYLPPPAEPLERFAARVRRELADAAGGEDPGELHTRWQPHEEWSESWRRGLAPRRITARIVVTPSWMEPPSEADDIVITLDPGLAFGTAEHATTRGCLRLLDGRVSPGDRLADIGAGSGILSIGAAHLGAASVLAIELDPWACEAARKNAEANRVADRVRVRAGAVDPDFLPDEAPFDGIVANIESGILTPLIPGFARGVRPGGWVILSGILRVEAGEILRVCELAGLTFDAEDAEDEWWSAAFRRSAPGPAPREAPVLPPGAD